MDKDIDWCSSCNQNAIICQEKHYLAVKKYNKAELEYLKNTQIFINACNTRYKDSNNE
jgi:hypothetical protein